MASNFKKGVFSSVLLVFDSFLKKLVGLASTLVLARVLLPEDFGIVAIATLIIGLIEVLSSTGSGQYLLRVDNLDDEKIDTAFTINVLIRAFLSLIGFASSFFIADYYDDQRLVSLVMILSGIFFLHSFTNPGLAYLRRQQNYKQIVSLGIFSKVLSVVVAVAIALIYQSYWALIAGKATTALVMVGGSYYIYSYKLKFMLRNAKEQWQFSGWMIPQAIFGYFRTQLDTFIVSSSFGQAELGSYHTMKYVSFIPSGHILRPVSAPFLVELNKTKYSPNYFAKQFKASFLLLLLIGLPITGVMHFHHDLVTLVLLGPNWTEYSYLLSAFAFLIPAFTMFNQAKRVLIVFAKTKQIFFYEVGAFCVVYGTIFMIGLTTIKAFSSTLVVMENLVSFLFFAFILIRYTGFKSCLLLVLSLIPFVSAFALAAFASTNLLMLDIYPFFQLLCASFIFGSVFVLVLTIFYILIFKKLEEWVYLKSLVDRLVAPILAKLGIAKGV